MSDAPPEAKPAPATAPRRRRAGAVTWLAAMLVMLLALLGASPFWAPALATLLPWGKAPSAQSAALAALSARLDAAEQQLDVLQSSDGQGLADRVTALERRPAPNLSAELAPLQDQLKQLEARLDDTDTKLATLSKDEAARSDSALRVLMLALAGLGNAVAGSGPFAAPLASVEALAQNRPGWAAALQPLEGSAKAGMPSTSVLAQQFSQSIAPAILDAHAFAPPPPGTGLGAAILARLRALVVIRRIGGGATPSDPVEAAVATGEAALDHGDLAGAVAALSGLNGAAGQAAAAWLGEARQRLAAEQTIARLTQELASDLAAGTGGG